jgi:hypothetical protein
MAYDKRNSKYGTVEINFTEIAEIFHKSSLTTLRGWCNGLVSSGLASEIDNKRHIFRVTNCDRYISGSNGNIGAYEKSERDQSVDVIAQSIGLISQSIDVNNQSTDQNTDDLLENSDSKALSYFKVGLGLVTKQAARTMEEYQSIYREGVYSLLIPDDMAWIDRHQNFNMVNN